MGKITSKSAIIIPGTTNIYGPLYEFARSAARNQQALLTVNINKVKDLIKKESLNRIIIIKGSKNEGAFQTYNELKRMSHKIKFILMDGWVWPVRKKDRMILLPVHNLTELIINNLKG